MRLVAFLISHNCGLHCIPVYCSNVARSARTRKLAGAVSVLVLQAMQSQLCYQPRFTALPITGRSVPAVKIRSPPICPCRGNLVWRPALRPGSRSAAHHTANCSGVISRLQYYFFIFSFLLSARHIERDGDGLLAGVAFLFEFGDIMADVFLSFG